MITSIATEPLAVTIPEAVRLSGISRTEMYRRLASGQICAVKSGNRTLVLLPSLRAHLSTLPPATFGGAVPAQLKRELRQESVP